MILKKDQKRVEYERVGEWGVIVKSKITRSDNV
jgi:hypothetical protein